MASVSSMSGDFTDYYVICFFYGKYVVYFNVV